MDENSTHISIGTKQNMWQNKKIRDKLRQMLERKKYKKYKKVGLEVEDILGFSMPDAPGVYRSYFQPLSTGSLGLYLL